MEGRWEKVGIRGRGEAKQGDSTSQTEVGNLEQEKGADITTPLFLAASSKTKANTLSLDELLTEELRDSGRDGLCLSPPLQQ